MTATLTSKGQITIPIKLRQRLNLKPGDKLEFDEQAHFLSARPAFDEAAMWKVAGTSKARGVFKGMTARQILDDLRGPVELPRRPRK